MALSASTIAFEHARQSSKNTGSSLWLSTGADTVSSKGLAISVTSTSALSAE